MSVIVKGMEMPKSCSKCGWFDMGGGDGYRCTLLRKSFDMWNKISVARDKNCPLIEIPTPHGRLIDADAHILEIRKQYCEDCSLRKGIKNGKMKFLYEIGGVVCRACEIEDMLDELDDAPTVIEAEGREE